MGVNNRQRRAAKQRQRAAERRAWASRRAADETPAAVGGRADAYGPGSEQRSDGTDRQARRRAAAEYLQAVVYAVAGQPATAPRFVAQLTGSAAPYELSLTAELLASLLGDSTRLAGEHGWSPVDVGQIVRRRLSERHLPVVVALLEHEVARHPDDRVAREWRAELGDLGPMRRVDLATPAGLETALEVASVLTSLPPIAVVIPPPGRAVRRAARGAADHRWLSRVRALLAKAESTDFADEADALSAKAQEIVTRYALDHLLDEPTGTAGADGDGGVAARRIWIDAPYIMPKATLVNVVAAANRCTSVVADKLGFSTVLGAPYDLEAVELLTTSLLVQANRAMLAHGRQAGWRGTSRTAPFRRSFLVAYAIRIGERLGTATDEAVEQTGHARELVPVLRQHAERVEAARDELFPAVRYGSAPTVSDRKGWVLGRAAADQARLEVRPAVGDAGS